MLSYKHTLRNERNFSFVEVTAERDAQGSLGSAEIRPFVASSAAAALDKERGRYQKLPDWWSTIVPLDSAIFADDVVWFHAAADVSLTAARDYVDENESFEASIVAEYKTSRLDDLARPKELRSVNFHDPSILEKQCADSLVRLWKVLPQEHATQMPHLSDSWVQRVILTKALGEIEALTSVEEWCDFVRRCFSLAAILRKAAKLCEAELIGPASDQGSADKRREISEDEAAAEMAAISEDRQAKERAFQDEMNRLADEDVEEFNRRLNEQKDHASDAMSRAEETPAQKRRRYAMERKMRRIQSRPQPLAAPEMSRYEKEQRRAERAKKKEEKEQRKRRRKKK